MYHSLQHLDLAHWIARDRVRHVRPVSPRRRRKLAVRLRLTADRAVDRGRGRGRARAPSRLELLLRDRAGAVRTDLLEIADLLDRADDPDPSCVADLEKLLSDGCGSPLYNPSVHPSELQATLYYARSWLEQRDIRRR